MISKEQMIWNLLLFVKDVSLSPRPRHHTPRLEGQRARSDFIGPSKESISS
jgi:hypothetical protein